MGYFNKDTYQAKIESYLKDIDNKYGTQYCPTGFARSQG